MSPLNHSLDTISPEGDTAPRMSDMRRVSMALAFSPARHRRRRQMTSMNSWFKTKLGLGWKRASRD